MYFSANDNNNSNDLRRVGIMKETIVVGWKSPKPPTCKRTSLQYVLSAGVTMVMKIRRLMKLKFGSIIDTGVVCIEYLGLANLFSKAR